MNHEEEITYSTLSEIALIVDEISGIDRVNSISSISTCCQQEELMKMIRQNKSSFKCPLPRKMGTFNDLKFDFDNDSLNEMIDLARTSDIIEPSNSKSSFEEINIVFEET